MISAVTSDPWMFCGLSFIWTKFRSKYISEFRWFCYDFVFSHASSCCHRFSVKYCPLPLCMSVCFVYFGASYPLTTPCNHLPAHLQHLSPSTSLSYRHAVCACAMLTILPFASPAFNFGLCMNIGSSPLYLSFCHTFVPPLF